MRCGVERGEGRGMRGVDKGRGGCEEVWGRV